MPRKPTGKPPGRPPKPTEDHLREGTYRPSRHRGRAPAKLAETPDLEADPSLELLRSLVADPPSWWQPCDLILLSILRESLEERARLRAEAMAGNLTASKELRAVDLEVSRMLESLGLTPTSRKRLDVDLFPSEGSRLESLRKRSSSRRLTAVEGGTKAKVEQVFERNGPQNGPHGRSRDDGGR